MQKHRENIKKYGFGDVLIFVLLSALFAAPVKAQGPEPTPTPSISDLKGDRERLKAKLAEIDNNIEAQAVATERALGDARTAAAARDAVSYGEAIGRAAENLAQMRASIEGKNSIIDRLMSDNSEQADQIANLKAQLQQASDTLSRAQSDLEQARSDNGLLKQSNQALQTQIAEQPKTDMPRFAAMLLAFVVVIGLFIAWGWHVIQNRKPAPPDDPQVIDQPIDRDDAIEGEYHED